MIETFADALPVTIHEGATRVMRETCERELMITVAESCTGGLLAAVLTDVEGCSHGFDRGFVTYTDDAKHEILGVSRAILERKGAVSPAAAIAMAAGALERSKAALALSVTGFAGPGGPDDEPGLVYFGLGWRSGLVSVTERRFGDISRAAVRIKSLEVATELILAVLTKARS